PACQSSVIVSFEVEVGGPGPEVGVPEHPDEGVLHPEPDPSAMGAAHRPRVPGQDLDRLRPLDALDFDLRQPDNTSVSGEHGILLTNDPSITCYGCLPPFLM